MVRNSLFAVIMRLTELFKMYKSIYLSNENLTLNWFLPKVCRAQLKLRIVCLCAEVKPFVLSGKFHESVPVAMK